MVLNYILIFLYAFLPFQFALNPAPGFDVAIMRIFIPLLTLFWLIEKVFNRERPVISSPIFWSLFSFVFFAFLSLFFAQNLGWGLRKILFLLTIMPLYFVMADTITDKKKLDGVVNGLLFGSFLISIFGIFQFLLQFFVGIESAQSIWSNYLIRFFLGNSFSDSVLQYPSWLVNIAGRDYFRAIGTFPDPHMFAFFLNMTLPFAFLRLIFEKKYRLFFAIATLTIFFASLLTFSRGGYLGLLFSFLIGILFYWRKIKSTTNKKIFLLGLIFVLFTLTIYTPIKNRLFSSFDQNDNSNSERIIIWKQAFQIIKENPQGVGLGNYSLHISPDFSYRDPVYAHNIYLDIAAETGLLGLFAWLSLLFFSFRILWKKRFMSYYYVACVMSLTAFAVHGLVENPLFSVHILVLLMFILALASFKKHALN